MPTCKKCETQPVFKTISLLRKHQWKEHKDTYAHVGRQVIKAPRARVQTLDIKKELTVRELITQLEAKHCFLGDVIALLKGSL